MLHPLLSKCPASQAGATSDQTFTPPSYIRGEFTRALLCHLPLLIPSPPQWVRLEQFVLVYSARLLAAAKSLTGGYTILYCALGAGRKGLRVEIARRGP